MRKTAEGYEVHGVTVKLRRIAPRHNGGYRYRIGAWRIHGNESWLALSGECLVRHWTGTGRYRTKKTALPFLRRAAMILETDPLFMEWATCDDPQDGVDFRF